MCIGKNNVYVIFAMIIMMNDDVQSYTTYVVHVFIGLYQNGRENDTRTYILLNTSNNDQYTMHMYCTVQDEYSTEYTVQYKVYHYFFLSSILLLLFFFGGGACTLYSAECIIIFCSAQFYLGGLSPQALMTRRPCLTPWAKLPLKSEGLQVVRHGFKTGRAKASKLLKNLL